MYNALDGRYVYEEIYYNGAYYQRVEDTDVQFEIMDDLNIQWVHDNNVVRERPIEFPYIDYWMPDVFKDYFYYSVDDKYIWAIYSFSHQTDIYIRK